MNDDTEIDIDELLKDVCVPANSASNETPNFNNEIFKTPDINPEDFFFNTRTPNNTAEKNPSEVDLTITAFPTVTEFYSKTPHNLFDTTDFYKKVLKGEGESTQRFHSSLTKFLTAKDPKDRGVFRQQVESSYWQFAAELAAKAASGLSGDEKRYALRFALVLPTLISKEQKNIFASVIDENLYNEPVYYLDEWLSAIGSGTINPSATDEVHVSRKDDTSRFEQLLEKANGKLQNSQNLLRAKSDERVRYEDIIKQKIEQLFTTELITGAFEARSPYSESQKQGIAQINEMLKNLLKLDKELKDFLGDYNQADSDVRHLKEKVLSSGGGQKAKLSEAAQEFDTVRQMAKMTCGRKGNHFPVLVKEYFRSTERDLATRENVLRELKWIESIDIQAYCRQYKTQLNRIPPFVILIPTYGDIGFCWEPFDRYNRVTSRGRIVIPMYTKNLKTSLLMATADLRWQVAKEKASYYWMEEGLTGNYYQWFQAQNLKGDIKEYFIQDYILWMTKESEGIQKLEKEVRDVFWRFMPFADSLKAELKKRSMVYQELCQKDLNRQMSDGY